MGVPELFAFFEEAKSLTNDLARRAIATAGDATRHHLLEPHRERYVHDSTIREVRADSKKYQTLLSRADWPCPAAPHN